MNAIEIVGSAMTSMMVLMVWSWLYKQNKFYAFAEHTVVGIAAGYAMVVGITNLNKMAIQPMTRGTDYVLIVPIVIGLLLFTRYSSKQYWISSYGMAFIVGSGIGIAMSTIMEAQVLTQVVATFPLLARPLGMDLLNGIIIIVTMVTTITYFIYTREHRGALGQSARLGRIAIMILLGNLYGSAISTRIGHVAAAMVVLLIENSVTSYYFVAIAIAILAFDIFRRLKAKQKI
ncbi:MAG: hypothetical protein V1857_02870 [archaeon]